MSTQAQPSNLRRTDSGTLVQLVSELSSVGGDTNDRDQGGVGEDYKDKLESDSSEDGEDKEGAGGIDVSDDDWDIDDSSDDDEDDDEDDVEEEDDADDDSEGDENAKSDDEMGSVEAREQLTLEDVEVIDDGALVAEHTEEVTLAAVPNSEHPRTRAARETLEAIYGEIDVSVRQAAEKLYPWLYARLRSSYDFDTSMRSSTSPEDANHTSAPSIFAARPTALHPVILSTIDCQGKKRAGFELILALALDANIGMLEPMQSAASAGMPLDVKIAPTVSLGNPSKSEAHGVYLLEKRGKFIVGRVTITTFLRRMEGQYSTAKKVLKGFGKDATSQRKDRKDYILADLRQFDNRGANVRWISAGMETMYIALFASTDEARGGLNTNTTDFSLQYGGRSFVQLRRIWALIKDILDQDSELTIVPDKRFESFYNSNLKVLVERAGLHETAAGINNLIRKISPLADTGKFPHFPALRQGAFERRRPLLYLRNRTYVRISKGELKNRRLPKNANVYPPLSATVAAQLKDIKPKDLASFAAQFSDVDLEVATVAKAANNFPKRMAQPTKRSTRRGF